MNYLVICLCLVQNYLSISKLNFLLLFLLLFLLIFLVFSLHKWYFPIISSIVFNFHRHYIIKFIYPSFITFIPHYVFFLTCINKVDGADEFVSGIGYTKEFNGGWVRSATEILHAFSIWAFIGSSFWNGNICYGTFSIIESSGGDNSTSLCTCVLYFLCCIFPCCIFLCCIKIRSLSETASSAICLKYFWLDSKEFSFSLSWSTRND